MLVACWSVKGGSGTTVVAVALAAVLARSSPRGAVVADLAGDVPSVVGLAHHDGPGLLEWLATPGDIPADALARIERTAPGGLSVLPAGGAAGEPVPGRGELLAAALAADGRPVVADCGCRPAGPALAVAASAAISLLVTRPCFLALRRAAEAPLRPSGIVLVDEPGRSLTKGDVEQVVGAPVRAVVRTDPAVARAVDAGLMSSRLPRGLARAVSHAA